MDIYLYPQEVVAQACSVETYSTEVFVSTGARTEWSWTITQYRTSFVILNILPKLV